tara:strand:- start:73 stop:1281 length:1209 start_codon:yes stop_codon:yes gene_type:complete
MPHAPNHGGDFGRQYSQQVINTQNRRVGLENTKAYQDIVRERNQSNAEQQLNQIVASKGQEGFRTDKIDPDRNFGKRTGKFNHIRDKMLKEGYGSLSQAEKAIADFYLSSAPNQYQSKIDQFIKASPENRAAYKKKFPFMGNLNLMATELPEKIAEKTMIGNFVSAMGNAKNKVVDTTLDFFNIDRKEEKSPYIPGEPYDPNQFLDPNFRDPIMDMVSADSTNIEEIKDTKDKTKQRINMNNLDETYNIESGMLLNNFRNVMNKGIANVSALPPNFAETFEKLKDTNQLTSGDILKAQGLLRDIVPINNQTNNQTGIINALPSETDLALGLNLMPTLEDLQNNPAVNTMQNVYKRLSDDQGLDINLQNRSLQYNQPMFGGNLSLTGNLGDNTGASLMFSKAI